MNRNLLKVCALLQTTIILSSCEKTSQENKVAANDASELSEAEDTPKKSSIYRYLAGVKTEKIEGPTLNTKGVVTTDARIQMTSEACYDALQFNKSPPISGIEQARDIQLPVKHTLYNVTVPVVKYREEIVQKPSEDGVIYNPETKRTPYTDLELIEGPIVVTGFCVGSEYIVSD